VLVARLAGKPATPRIILLFTGYGITKLPDVVRRHLPELLLG
jgi:hypothetical protein